MFYWFFFANFSNIAYEHIYKCDPIFSGLSMLPPLLTLQNIHLTFGVTPLLSGAEIYVQPGDKICLVGRNGSGKSTFLKIAAGMIQPDDGERFVQPGVTIRYLPQEPDFSGYETIFDFVKAGLSPTDDPYNAQILLEQFQLNGGEDPSTLSGGEAKRAALVQAMAPEPDILLLDEPTNHLDLPMIEWVENELIRLKSAIVLISHDRRLLENVSRKTVWIERGQSRVMEKGFKYFESWRDDVFEQEERDQHKLKQRIAMEEDWLRYGVTARRKRNVKRLANLHDLRHQRKTASRPEGNAIMTALEADQSAKLVIEAKNINKSYEGRPIVQDFSIRVKRGDRLGIVGPNGSGKTTLISLLTGALEQDSGHIRLGKNLESVTLDQSRTKLKDDMTLADALTGGNGHYVILGDEKRHVAGFMKEYLFKPEQMNTPVHVLSGGERGRILLARALATPSNFLILDEPTNDLDLETLDLLEEMLSDYTGTILLISHDRDFLDRIVTSVLYPDGKGNWTEYAGGYSDMLVQLKAAGQSTLKTKSTLVKNKNAQQGGAKKQEQEEKDPLEKNTQKLSFKQKHLLESLPNKMQALQNDIEKLQNKLAEPDLYAKNPENFQKYSKMLSIAETRLEEAETQWLELEMLREEIES